MNFELVPEREVVPDETVLQTDLCNYVIRSKLAELEKWKACKVYDEVDDDGQEVITMQWVITQENPNMLSSWISSLV